MNISKLIKKYNSIHFIGIGGISVSALAKLCLFYGATVSGSDNVKSKITEDLINLGADITYYHLAENISKNVKLVVYTSAINKNNPELLKAKQLNIPVLERSEFLGLIARCYKNVICVSGTHGKTTTTAMLGCIFSCAGLNPTVHLGGECDNFSGNLLIGNNDFFITEACEYKKHFLKVKGNISVVLNAEYDHPDSYNNLNEVLESFNQFIYQSKDIAVVNETFKTTVKHKIISFGFKNANFTANNIIQSKNGIISFDCYKNKAYLGKIKLHAFGVHNVLNSLAVISVADYYRIPFNKIAEGFLLFKGVNRRFEIIGNVNGNLILHDYAHHPTEIKAAIKAVKNLIKKPIVCVFQPHTYSRTLSLIDEFCYCFNKVKKLILLPTYPAREIEIIGGRSEDLYNKIKKHKQNCVLCKNFESCVKLILSQKNCTILILGAGDVYEMCKSIKKTVHPFLKD